MVIGARVASEKTMTTDLVFIVKVNFKGFVEGFEGRNGYQKD